jgi:hypothetical protein
VAFLENAFLYAAPDTIAADVDVWIYADLAVKKGRLRKPSENQYEANCSFCTMSTDESVESDFQL